MSDSVTRLVWVIAAVGTLLVGVSCTSDPESAPGSDATTESFVVDTSTMEERVAERIEEYLAAARGAPDDSKRWGFLGAVCHAHDVYDCAEQGYTRARRMNPTEFRWPYLLAMVREITTDDVDEVIDLYRESAQLRSNYPPTYYRIGELLSDQGRFEEARQEYQRALDLDPEMAVSHRGLAQVLIAMNDPEQALVSLELALRSGECTRVFAAQAQAYAQLGDLDRAREAQARSRATTRVLPHQDPVHADVISFRVSALHTFENAKKLMAQGQFDSALEQLLLVAETFKDDASLHHHLGGAYARTGELDKALVHLQRAVELTPDVPGPRDELGRLLLETGRAAEALPHLERLVELKPEFVRGREMLARARAAAHR